MSLQYQCPSCESVVYHDCVPPSYRKTQGRLPRIIRLPRLRFVDPEEIRQAHRERWQSTSPVAESLTDALGDAALRGEE